MLGRIENVKVGDVVLAIGNPFGVGQARDDGYRLGAGPQPPWASTRSRTSSRPAAAINPGSSGGALVDAQGNLLGINTAIYSRSGGSLGIGFAIPSRPPSK